MAYEFKPPGAAGIDTKKIGLALVAVLVIFVLYSVGTVVTGYTTYTSTLESELNNTKEELKIVSAAREECSKELNDKTSLYGQCSSSLQNANTNLDKCGQDLGNSQATYSQCKSELDSLKSNQSAAATGYKNLVRNSVKAICCTIADVDSASVKQWRIENDKIICSGNLTVNCATGETNYS